MNSKPENRLGEPSVLRKAEDLTRQGDVESARKLLSAETGNAAKVLLARLCVRSGDPVEAEIMYREVLESDAGNLAALRSLAARAQAEGRFDEARDLLNRWAAEDPDDPEHEDLLGQLEPSALGFDPGNTRPLPVADDLEEILTRPETPEPRQSGILEGELLPAPSLTNPDLWDLGDNPRSSDSGQEV